MNRMEAIKSFKENDSIAIKEDDKDEKLQWKKCFQWQP